MASTTLLGGAVLLGFSKLFDAAYGDPRTSQPYPRVTPSTIAGVLLPFSCPHCGAVRGAAVDPRRRAGYRDKSRGFSWCPRCRGRYVLDTRGAALEAPVDASVGYAPAWVDGRLRVPPAASGLDLLGVD